MDESYCIIRDVLNHGFWNVSEQRFRGILYAYKVDINKEIVSDPEFQKARRKASMGVEVIKVYK